MNKKYYILVGFIGDCLDEIKKRKLPKKHSKLYSKIVSLNTGLINYDYVKNYKTIYVVFCGEYWQLKILNEIMIEVENLKNVHNRKGGKLFTKYPL